MPHDLDHQITCLDTRHSRPSSVTPFNQILSKGDECLNPQLIELFDEKELIITQNQKKNFETKNQQLARMLREGGLLQ